MLRTEMGPLFTFTGDCSPGLFISMLRLMFLFNFYLFISMFRIMLLFFIDCFYFLFQCLALWTWCLLADKYKCVVLLLAIVKINWHLASINSMNLEAWLCFQSILGVNPICWILNNPTFYNIWSENSNGNYADHAVDNFTLIASHHRVIPVRLDCKLYKPQKVALRVMISTNE